MNKLLKITFSTVLAAAIVVCSPLLGTSTQAESINKSADRVDIDLSSDSISGILSKNDVPECLDFEAIADKEHATRLFDKETALDTVLFANKDGSETIYIFNEDVKYIDESGKIADKSNKLYSNIESRAYSSDYSYVNKENDINTYFPKSLMTDVGVSVEAQGQVIEMYPVSDVVSNVIANDDMYGVYYDDVFGEFTGIRYKPSFSGYKEDIILEKNVGNKFGFILETGDLVPVLENGVIYIRDENGEDFGIISPTYVYDSFAGDVSLEDKRHFTYNNKFELTHISDGKYELVVIVDKEFLNDPATVYPVIVDPSFSIDGSESGLNKSILDTPIYNGSGAVDKSAGHNQLAVIGYVDSSYGSGRLLMRFPGLMKQSFMNPGYQIKSATLTMTECSGGAATSTIYAYNYTGSAWDESTSYSSYAYNGIGSSIDFWSFNNPNSSTKTYNIINAVKNWQTDYSLGEKGIIFKNTTSESDYSKTKTFYTTEGATKPYLSITYEIERNEFYSKYDPEKFNNTGSIPAVGTQTDLIQYRMNCYGYAFCNILDGSAEINNDGGYKQQPGDFARTSDKSKVKKNSVGTDTKQSMENIVSNMQLDASRLGYTISEYTPSSSTVKQCGTTSRMIAVVTGEVSIYYDGVLYGGVDYHFYMQHSDGTWSHKPGSLPVTNLSLKTQIDDPQYKLTNANIRAYANKGAYEGGELKFFEITKSAVIDHPHGEATMDAQNMLYYNEKAGDYIQTSVTKSTGTTYARIDFAEDHDVYCFKAPTTKTYTIETTCSGSDLDCKVYDTGGAEIKRDTSTGQVNITISMSAGETYFFDISNYSKKVTDYMIKIS